MLSPTSSAATFQSFAPSATFAPQPATTTQEQQVILQMMSAQQELEAAIAHAESLKDRMVIEVPGQAADVLQKVIVIDGKRSIGINKSVEEVMEIVRTLYGRSVQLIGASEVEQGGERRLELSFERPESYSLTRQLASYNVF